MPSSVTEKEVSATIMSLLEKGEWPNYLNVRKELGGQGSGPTLSRMIDAWYAKHGPSMTMAEPQSSIVDRAFREVIAAFDISAIRTEQVPGTAVGAAFKRIGTTLAQLHLVMEAWESDLTRREAAMAERQKATQDTKYLG